MLLFFFFKQKTAYEMRISDWSSDVCSSDLPVAGNTARPQYRLDATAAHQVLARRAQFTARYQCRRQQRHHLIARARRDLQIVQLLLALHPRLFDDPVQLRQRAVATQRRSEARRVGKECVSTCSTSGAPYN